MSLDPLVRRPFAHAQGDNRQGDLALINTEGCLHEVECPVLDAKQLCAKAFASDSF